MQTQQADYTTQQKCSTHHKRTRNHLLHIKRNNPTTSSNVYTGPISITSTTTLKFFAVDLAGNPSPTYTETYTIDTTTPTANANPTGGLYNTTQNVVITTSEPGTIYYTTNGTIQPPQATYTPDQSP